LTALLFGLHPLRVESVVWATERKDVLYSFFYLSAVYVYLGRDFTQGVKSKKLWLCWTLFLLSIMSKLMAMTLPVVFLLLDIWPLHRFGNFKRTVWVEKVPFFVLSIFAGGMALLGTESRTFSMAGNVTLFQRIVNPFHSLAFYIWKMAFPFNLSPLYPFDRALDGAFYAKAALAVIFVAGVSIYCFAKRATQPAWGIGWLFYIVTLLPVLGILQVGGQAAADRYTYLPCLGIFAPVSAAIVLLLSDRKKILSVGALLALLLGFATVLQIGYWKDSETLWGRVTTLYPDQSAFAHTSLAFAYQEEGRTEDALGEYKRAITIPPPLPITYNGMGALLSQMGRNDEAIQTLKNANVIDPKYISAHLNLWTVYVTLGRNQEALTEVLEAIRLDPEVADFYCRLGLNYKALGRIQEARAAFEKAGAMDSANPQYQGEIMKLLTEKTPN
jgi:tetratricopeptide (TPR) repeat protein